MKRKQHITWSLAFLVIFHLLGCIEKFEANLDVKNIEGLAIEGNIISDSIVVFQLSKTLPIRETENNTNDFSDYLQVHAELSVKGSDGSHWQGYGIGNGKYRVAIGTLHPEETYHVEITYNGATYQSVPQKPLACSGIESFSYHQPHSDAPVTVTLNTQERDLNETRYYLWFYEEDWEVHAIYASRWFFEPTTERIRTYSTPPYAQGWCYNGANEYLLETTESKAENRIVDLKVISIENNQPRLSCLYSIRIQQRNLSREEYEYYQVRAKQNSEMGGLFTPQATELPTNLICSEPSRKIIGFVGCNMGVAYAQLYISTDDIHYQQDFDCDMGKGPSGTSLDKYAAGYQIADFLQPSTYVWAKRQCVDVRSLGANPQGRPSWWPNPYVYENPMMINEQLK